MGKTLTIDKKMWELMGNTFYSIFFGLLWSALFLWDQGVFKWHQSNYTITIIIILTMLFCYYILDWLDANLASVIDPKIKKIDIFLWLISTMWLSTIIVLFIKKFDASELKFLYLAVYLSWIYCLLTTFLRDKLLAIKIKDESWVKDRKVYDNASKYIWIRRILLIYFILLIPPILDGEPLVKLFELFDLKEVSRPFVFMFLLFIPSIIYKMLRSKWILIPLSEQNNNNK